MSVEPIGKFASGSACALFDPDGRILLVKHSYGRLNWELPGGGAFPGEDPSTTARRELREETDLDLWPDRLTGVYFEPNHEHGPFVHFVFNVPWAAMMEPTPSSPEITHVAFWPLDALPRPMSDFTLRRIEDATRTDTSFAVINERRWLP